MEILLEILAEFIFEISLTLLDLFLWKKSKKYRKLRIFGKKGFREKGFWWFRSFVFVTFFLVAWIFYKLWFLFF